MYRSAYGPAPSPRAPQREHEPHESENVCLMQMVAIGAIATNNHDRRALVGVLSQAGDGL